MLYHIFPSNMNIAGAEALHLGLLIGHICAHLPEQITCISHTSQVSVSQCHGEALRAKCVFVPSNKNFIFIQMISFKIIWSLRAHVHLLS